MQRDEKPQAKYSKTALLLSGGAAGIAETALFHPIDTTVTRLQASQHKIHVKGQSIYEGVLALDKTLFNEGYDKTALSRMASLYNGVSFAFLLKCMQRTAKFGGQQMTSTQLNKRIGPPLKEALGEKKGKILLEGMSGSIMACFGLPFLPLDNLKTKYQNQKNLYKQQSLWRLIKSEKWHLYNGAGVTLLRNIPGSFVLFGTSGAVKEGVFHVNHFEDATLKQNMIAAAFGSVATIISTNAIDVVKTRVQSRSGTVSALSIFRETLKQEGASAFLKGMTTRIFTVAPKLTFALGLSQSLPGLWKRFSESKQAKPVENREQETMRAKQS
jgi:hypothetical protein